MSIPDSTAPSKPPVVREVPQFVLDFTRGLRGRRFTDEAMNGGTSADIHRQETGHALYKGCCSDPANRCIGCHEVLPRAAKVRGELYCSQSCREAARNG